MKTLLLTAIVISNLLTIAPAFAALGNSSGGGGDEREERVNSIRADIYKWIENGGSNGLKLPNGMFLKEYNEAMLDILTNKKVIVSFVADDNSQDEELRVLVNGTPKTCRGFISKKDSQKHILCNIPRFDNTSESGQYRLIHHEYAGLARVEQNEGAASDYYISSQITNYLTEQKVLRLAVNPDKQLCKFSDKNLNNETRRIVRAKGYNIVTEDFKNANEILALEVKTSMENASGMNLKLYEVRVEINEWANGISYEFVAPIKKSKKCNNARETQLSGIQGLLSVHCDNVEEKISSAQLINESLKSLPNCAVSEQQEVNLSYRTFAIVGVLNDGFTKYDTTLLSPNGATSEFIDCNNSKYSTIDVSKDGIPHRISYPFESKAACINTLKAFKAATREQPAMVVVDKKGNIQLAQ
jgi:hypothetical protein